LKTKSSNWVKPLVCATALALAVSSALAQTATLPPLPPTPPQDQGLPYTRTSHAQALDKIRDCIAVFPGSRYAYDKGLRIRLDEQNWHDEAVSQNGTVYVPQAFISVLAVKTPKADTPPDYLTYRWVYTIDRPQTAVPSGVATMDVAGHPYIDLIAAAKAMGWDAYQHPRGYVLIGNPPPKLDGVDPAHLDAIVTLFDTPEKLADPDIATQYVPTLKRQGKWTDHVKVTPEQMKILEGPETNWPTTPESQFDYTGFNKTLLGSAVPPPGVYPRILFSEQDIPALAARVKATKAGTMALIEIEYLLKKSWWDPASSDGQVFQKLASGDVAGLDWGAAPGTLLPTYPQTFKGEKPGIHNSHVAYIPECLCDMALYCLLTGDDQHGQMAAHAIVNYYKLREPLIDEENAISDSEYGGIYTRPNGEQLEFDGNGSETNWRNMHGLVAHMNLGLSLDFAGKWMSGDEKDTMRRIIVKATYGRRGYGQDGPKRFRDVNWVAWDLPNFLALASIEGLPGFDREAYESNCDTVRAFCDWGIDDSGVIYESTGKNPGSLQFQTLSMVTLARRGLNLFGHPHWRKLLTGQIQTTSPSGKVTVNSGTQYVPYSQSQLSYQMVDEEKAFFPDDRRPDFLLERAKLFGGKSDEGFREWMLDDFNADEYRQQVAKVQRLRMPSPTYPGFVHGMLYDADFIPTTRADLNLPLDYNAPVHGMFSSYSDTSTDAAWIQLMVRPDHYIGAGHHHADAGNLHFSALGVDWFTQSQFSGLYDGRYYNVPQVDGHSEAEPDGGTGTAYQAAATYLGANISDGGAFATADLTNSYSYRWCTQPPQVWPAGTEKAGWEMDPSDYIAKMFAGTAHYKMRPWWATYNYVNYMPTSRAPFNPMQYVFRSAGLVRGAHPYGLVVDDLKKDDQTHRYQWIAMLNGPIWQAKVDGLPDGVAALAAAKDASDQKPFGSVGKPPLEPQSGDPLLLVYPLGVDPKAADDELIKISSEAGPPDKKGVVQFYDRIAINQRGTELHMKLLLIPVRSGGEMPKVTYDAGASKATIAWADQSDDISFVPDNNRTKVTVTRSGKPIAQSN
jgi:hypothetical protein